MNQLNLSKLVHYFLAVNKLCNNYKVDQKRMAEDRQKKANPHKGAWKVIFGVGTVVVGAVTIYDTLCIKFIKLPSV